MAFWAQGVLKNRKGLKCILLFSEIFERSVGGVTLNYSLAIPASPSPLLFGFLRFFEAAFFRGAIRSLQEKVEGGGKPPFAVCRGEGGGNSTIVFSGGEEEMEILLLLLSQVCSHKNPTIKRREMKSN